MMYSIHYHLDAWQLSMLGAR